MDYNYKDKYCVLFNHKGDNNFYVMKGKNSNIVMADEDNKYLLEQIIRQLQSENLYEFAMIVKVTDVLN